MAGKERANLHKFLKIPSLEKKKLHYRKKMPFFLDHIIIRAAAFCSAIMNGFVSNLRRPRRELELQGGKGERLHSCFE